MDLALEVRYEEGIVQGLEQGLEKGAAQIAANMLKDGLDPALISRYSGLDINTIILMGQ